MKPINLINSIRASFIGAEHVYTHGSCFQFYRILNAAFPGAEPYILDDHIITKIDGFYYDITGFVDGTGSVPYEDNYLDECRFSLWDCGLECPNCDEIVCYSSMIN
jgi:hypothetical protein